MLIASKSHHIQSGEGCLGGVNSCFRMCVCASLFSFPFRWSVSFSVSLVFSLSVSMVFVETIGVCGAEKM